MNPSPAHDCPLCGTRFEEGAARCGGCTISRGYGASCCPRCGYEFADRSATVDAVLKVTRGLRDAWRAAIGASGGER